MARLINMRPDQEVEPNLGDHLLELRKRNQSERSIRERRLTVLRVARHLGHPLGDVTRAELVDWQTQRLNHTTRTGERLSATALHNDIVHVSCYLRWLVKEERRLDDPSVVLVRPRHSRQGIPHPMSDRDITRALQAATEADLHLWIGLGAFCGLRCMEMAKLAREDIIDAGLSSSLRIIGKGRKERIVPLPAALRAEIESGPFSLHGHLFARMDGKPGPPSAVRVSERINDHLHSLGISATAHALRHRYGTELYRKCRDPYKVAQLMGHASTDTTRGYVALVNDEDAALAESITNLAS